jgi:chromatin segregation and condensation protein Rec8/ScpA/Scc1 (kleisin family)
VVDGFTGPLDWPLAMVRANRIDLARLSIAALIEAFAQALADRHFFRIEHWAVWTVMAATLTDLWSWLLLPNDAPEARAAAAVGYLRQLAEHHFRFVAHTAERLRSDFC